MSFFKTISQLSMFPVLSSTPRASPIKAYTQYCQQLSQSMSCSKDWNNHSPVPRNRQQTGIQTAACQILFCLPVVVQAADNIDTLSDISGNTWQNKWEGTCLQDYSKWAVLSHSLVSPVLTAAWGPHVSAHLCISTRRRQIFEPD